MILRETKSTTRQTFEAAARRARINIRTELKINNREATREAVVLDLGLSVGAEIEFGSHRSLRWLPVRDAEMYIELYLTRLSQRRDRTTIKRLLKSPRKPKTLKIKPRDRYSLTMTARNLLRGGGETEPN